MQRAPPLILSNGFLTFLSEPFGCFKVQITIFRQAVFRIKNLKRVLLSVICGLHIAAINLDAPKLARLCTRFLISNKISLPYFWSQVHLREFLQINRILLCLYCRLAIAVQGFLDFYPDECMFTVPVGIAR